MSLVFKTPFGEGTIELQASNIIDVIKLQSDLGIADEKLSSEIIVNQVKAGKMSASEGVQLASQIGMSDASGIFHTVLDSLDTEDPLYVETAKQVFRDSQAFKDAEWRSQRSGLPDTFPLDNSKVELRHRPKTDKHNFEFFELHSTGPVTFKVPVGIPKEAGRGLYHRMIPHIGADGRVGRAGWAWWDYENKVERTVLVNLKEPNAVNTQTYIIMENLPPGWEEWIDQEALNKFPAAPSHLSAPFIHGGGATQSNAQYQSPTGASAAPPAPTGDRDGKAQDFLRELIRTAGVDVGGGVAALGSIINETISGIDEVTAEHVRALISKHTGNVVAGQTDPVIKAAMVKQISDTVQKARLEVPPIEDGELPF